MLTLYHSNQSRSVRPRWLLEEIGAPFELRPVNLVAGEQKKPDYLKINPNGTVPTLVDDDLVLFESAAICQYLADKFPAARLAPATGTSARALYYQWIHFARSAIEPPLVTLFENTISKPEAERIPALLAPAKAQLAAALAVLERALAGRTFVLGTEFSTADVMLGSTLVWAQMIGLLGAETPNVAAYIGRLITRPAFQRAAAD